MTVPFSIALVVVTRRGVQKTGASRARVLIGCLLILSPAALGLLLPRAVTPLAEEGVGSTWSRFGLDTFVDRIALMPALRRGGPDLLVAGGSGLFVAPIHPGRDSWLPTPVWHRVAAFPPSSLVLGLTVESLPARPLRIFVGTVAGAFEAPSPLGPYRRLAVHGGGVHAIAVDPSNPAVVWLTSYAGPERSTNGGRSFVVETRGMRAPGTSWAISYFEVPSSRPVLLCSDEDAVYRWTGSRWSETIAERSVVSLDPVRRSIWSSSMGSGVESGIIGNSGRLTWHPEDGGLQKRRAGPIVGTHVMSVTAAPGNAVMYAGTMIDGVAVSLDSGASWSGAWEGLRSHGVVSRVLDLGGTLVAATDGGIYAYDLPTTQPGSALWWLVLTVTALAGSLVGAAVLLGRPLSVQRRKRSSENGDQ